MNSKGTAVQFFRVSSKGQEDGFSLDAQRDLGDEYAARNKLHIVYDPWRVIESASKEAKRKQFFSMIDYVRENNVENIIFDKVDRAVRGYKCASILNDMLENEDKRFHFTRSNFVVDKDSSPQEKFRFFLEIGLAKLQTDNMAIDIKRSLNQRLAEGLWNNPAPSGYRHVRDPRSGRSSVEVDPQLGPAVRRVFELYATGNYSYPELIPIINDAAPDGKQKEWKLIPSIISNPFYYGARRRKGKVLKELGVHEPLITKELWTACQRVKATRAAKHIPNKEKRAIPKPFMQLLKCGHCGHAITGEAPLKPNGKFHIYYRCAYRKCAYNKERLPQDAVNEMLNVAFRPFEAFTPKATEAAIRTIQERAMDLDKYTTTKIVELREAVKEAKERILRIDELLAAGHTTQARRDEVINLAEAEIARADLEVGAYSRADRKTFADGLRLIQLFTKISDYSKVGADLRRKAELARMILSNPEVKDGTLRFDYVKPLDEILKIAEARVWWR